MFREPPPFLSVQVNEVSCAPFEKRGILWPKTLAGHTAEVPCPSNMHGKAHWECNVDGQWKPDGYDLSRCASTWSKRWRSYLFFVYTF